MKETVLNRWINVSIALFAIISAAIGIGYQLNLYEGSPLSLAILNFTLLLMYLTQLFFLRWQMINLHNYEYQFNKCSFYIQAAIVTSYYIYVIANPLMWYQALQTHKDDVKQVECSMMFGNTTFDHVTKIINVGIWRKLKIMALIISYALIYRKPSQDIL